MVVDMVHDPGKHQIVCAIGAASESSLLIESRVSVSTYRANTVISRFLVLPLFQKNCARAVKPIDAIQVS